MSKQVFLLSNNNYNNKKRHLEKKQLETPVYSQKIAACSKIKESNLKSTNSNNEAITIAVGTTSTDDTITMIMVVVLFLCCNTLVENLLYL